MRSVQRLRLVAKQCLGADVPCASSLLPAKLRVRQFPMASTSYQDWNEFVPKGWAGDMNYGYAIVDDANQCFAMVDPADLGACLRVIAEEQARGNRFVAILSTHWHWDHAGGNTVLHERFPDVPIYGRSSAENAPLPDLGPHPDFSRFPWKVPECITHELPSDGLACKIGDLDVQAIAATAHTDNHIAYFVTGDPSQPPALFSGDALFLAGCGRWSQRKRAVHEGSLPFAQENLVTMNKFAKLPRETLIYCAHEYSLKNLHYSLSVDPGNAALREKARWCIQQRTTPGRSHGYLSTVPSSIGDELEYNLFMRARSAEEMQKLRDGKDNFSGTGQADDPDFVRLAAEPCRSEPDPSRDNAGR